MVIGDFVACHKCRPEFVKFKRRWSLAAFRGLREKYTDQHIELGEAYQRIKELEHELERLRGK